MPYSPAQCRLFGAKASRGESVPKDWKEHCRKKPEIEAVKKGTKLKRRKA